MAKGAQAKAAKAAHQEEVKKGKAAKFEADEASKWEPGAKGKGKKEDKEDKAAAARAAKAERDRLLAEEEAGNAKAKPAPPPKSSKKPAVSATSTAPKRPSGPSTTAGDIPTYSASNLDDALDALDLANEKTDKATVGAKAASGVETHPERRFKAAFEAYKERELPELRKSHPGLRLQQYNEKLYQAFQKSPENPFNQVTAGYNASKEDKVSAMAAQRAEMEKRLRTD